MPTSVIGVVHWISHSNKYEGFNTYNDDIITPDDVPNNPQDNDEASDN